MSQITIDLREAYDAKIPCLPEIETAIDKMIKAAGRSVGVTVLRESLELVHSANAFNLLCVIQKGDEEADFLRRGNHKSMDMETYKESKACLQELKRKRRH